MFGNPAGGCIIEGVAVQFYHPDRGKPEISANHLPVRFAMHRVKSDSSLLQARHAYFKILAKTVAAPAAENRIPLAFIIPVKLHRRSGEGGKSETVLKVDSGAYTVDLLGSDPFSDKEPAGFYFAVRLGEAVAKVSI